MHLEEVAIFTEKFFKDDFSGNALNLEEWDVVLGDGQSIVIADSNLKIQAGIKKDAETIIKRKLTCKIPLKLGFLSAISQRIPYQEIRIGIESTRGNNRAELVFDGVENSVKILSLNNGYSASSDSVSLETNFSTLFIHELRCFSTQISASSQPSLTTGGNFFQ